MTAATSLLLEFAEHGLCRGADEEVFFPVGPVNAIDGTTSDALNIKRPLTDRQRTEAETFCTPCPVRSQCLDWALHNEHHGIWAGTGPHERNQLRRALGISTEATPPPDHLGCRHTRRPRRRHPLRARHRPRPRHHQPHRRPPSREEQDHTA